MRNYNRDFAGQSTLETSQKLVAYGDLKCIHSGDVFCNAWVNSYNQYTHDFNRATNRAAQEFMLDQRHSFYMACCSIMSEQNENAALAA